VSSHNFLSITSQVADRLRLEIANGRWKEVIPGRNSLAEELSVSPKTVECALSLLENEGILIGQGAGRRRRITAQPKSGSTCSMRIAILNYEAAARKEDTMVDLLHCLEKAGHRPFYTSKSLLDLKMDPKRVVQEVRQTTADAWIVCAAPREILAWFAEQETPVMALFGRRRELPIAGVGPDHISASRDATKRLIELGHKRIVLITRNDRRGGGGGGPERAIFDEMSRHGLSVGPYNMPEWEESAEGLRQLLDNLLQITPPTALIIDEAFIFHATMTHLAQRGVLSPADISLICCEPDATFAWCRPSVSFIQWDHRPITRRIESWARNLAQGKIDQSQTLTKAEFIEGGTVGPAA